MEKIYVYHHHPRLEQHKAAKPAKSTAAATPIRLIVSGFIPTPGRP